MSAQGELAPGTIFGGYRIDQLIGRGGMGVVYRATQLALERPVALKAIQGHLAQDESFRHRFRREVMMAASIDHPNIIPVYEAGEIDGIPFLAMRYVPGTDLGLMIEQQGQLPLELIREVGEQIASALDAAHGAGLVHRDVKPGNILVAQAGPGEAHSYLTDFGLTKGRGESHLTKTGTWVGTVSYIAPEQIEGQKVDGRADLYSLACVLYECVTGHPPFQRDSDVAMLYAHLQDERPRAGAARADVPPALDAVLLRGMARDPDERYQSGSALARALREALGRSSVTLPLPGLATPPPVQPTQVGGSTPPLSPPPLAATQVGSTPPPYVPPGSGGPGTPRGPGGGRNRMPLLIGGGVGVLVVGAIVAVALASGGGGGGGTSTEVLTTTTAPTVTEPTTTTAPTEPTGPTSTDPTDPNAVPALDGVYHSDAGPEFGYPTGWTLDKTARKDTPKETFFEYVAVGSHGVTNTPMYLRVVFGPPADFSFFDSVTALVKKAKDSVRNSPFNWTATFNPKPGDVTIDGAPGAVLGFSWKGKSTAEPTEGAGYLFVARNAAQKKWIYGWAAYDTEDRETVGETRIDTRRETLAQVLDTIHWS